MSLRILIADDESLARSRLRQLVEELGHQVCAEAPDGFTAERLLRDSNPDAVLLDIEMPGIDGLALAKRLETQCPGIPVVLVTAHSEHAIEAFDAQVRDYVLKPVRRERLERALSRVRNHGAGTVPRLRLTIGRREQLVPLDELDCLVAEDGYVIARSAKIEGFVAMSLQELEARLGTRVLRAHRSCLVVKAAVTGLDTRGPADHRISFRDGLPAVKVSRRQLGLLKRFLQLPPTPG